jgi:hypothetical protein
MGSAGGACVPGCRRIVVVCPARSSGYARVFAGARARCAQPPAARPRGVVVALRRCDLAAAPSGAQYAPQPDPRGAPPAAGRLEWCHTKPRRGGGPSLHSWHLTTTPTARQAPSFGPPSLGCLAGYSLCFVRLLTLPPALMTMMIPPTVLFRHLPQLHTHTPLLFVCPTLHL